MVIFAVIWYFIQYHVYALWQYIVLVGLAQTLGDGVSPGVIGTYCVCGALIQLMGRAWGFTSGSIRDQDTLVCASSHAAWCTHGLY